MNMIYIIRHGQTELNKRFALQGRSDLPLNERGEMDAIEAGAMIRDMGISIDLIYTSPLKRAVRTAELIASGYGIPADSIIADDRLIEMDYGPYEGMDLTDPAPEVLAFFKDFTNVPAPAGMEPLPEVVTRLGQFIEDIRDSAAAGNILISTHAIAMKGALEYLTPDSKGSYWSKNIANCEIYAAEMIDGRYGVPYKLEPDVSK